MSGKPRHKRIEEQMLGVSRPPAMTTKLPKNWDPQRPLPNFYLEKFAQRLAMGIDNDAWEALRAVCMPLASLRKSRSVKSFATRLANKIRPRVLAILEDMAKDTGTGVARRRALLIEIAERAAQSDVARLVKLGKDGSVQIDKTEWEKGGIQEASFRKDKDGTLTLDRVKMLPKTDAIFAISELNRMEMQAAKLKQLEGDSSDLAKVGIQINVVAPKQLDGMVPGNKVIDITPQDPKAPLPAHENASQDFLQNNLNAEVQHAEAIRGDSQ